MQSAVRIVVSLFLLSSALASYHSSTKLRRDGVLNLYPFPRVGRASKNTWQVPIDDLYSEYEPVGKRQLYAFPRVGRSDLPLLYDPLNPDHQPLPSWKSDAPGMWFGPRLGRSYKSEKDDAVEKRQLYAFPRVGRGEGSSKAGTARRNENTGILWFGPRIGRSYNTEEDDAVQKRQLYAFPRVGRDSDLHTGEKGMWFGPRIGRSFKSDEDDTIQIQNETIEHGDPEQIESAHEERTKRQTESV